MFVLFTILGSVLFSVVDETLGLKYDDTAEFGEGGILGAVFSLATFIPSLTVAVRRLHDTDRSGLWLLLPVGIAIVALIAVGGFSGLAGGTDSMELGMIVAGLAVVASFGTLLVFFCLDGTRGPNRFGEDPKGVAYDGVFD